MLRSAAACGPGSKLARTDAGGSADAGAAACCVVDHILAESNYGARRLVGGDGMKEANASRSCGVCSSDPDDRDDRGCRMQDAASTATLTPPCQRCTTRGATSRTHNPTPTHKWQTTGTQAAPHVMHSRACRVVRERSRCRDQHHPHSTRHAQHGNTTNTRRIDKHTQLGESQREFQSKPGSLSLAVYSGTPVSILVS